MDSTEETTKSPNVSKQTLTFQDALTSYREEFGSAREDAHQYCNSQRSHWISLLSSFQFGASNDLAISKPVDQLISLIQKDDTFSVEERRGIYSVIGKLPFISQEKVKLLEATFESSDTFLAALICETDLSVDVNILSPEPVSLSILVRMLRYQTGGQTPIEALRTREGFEHKLEDLFRRTQTKLDDVQTQLTGTVEEFSQELADQKSTLAAQATEERERLRLQTSSELWSNQTTIHLWSFIVWFVLFAGIAVGVGAYIYTNIVAIAADIPKDKEGVITYHSLVFFIVPVVAVAWLLRLISRFVSTSLLLRDDARHRDAMLKTYLALVGNKDSKVDEKDRLVMLTAIFRPLPGAQSEDVAPPSIMDLVKTK